MTLPVILRAEAEADLAEVRDWYEEKLVGLGDEFVSEAERFFARIASFPELYAIVIRNARRGKLRRFPYVVYYRVLTDKIEIFAVLRGSRDSKTWRSRLR